MSNYKSKRNNYIDLKINGRLFPSSILANFKKYKLDEIIKTDDDPCFRKIKHELKKYQTFLAKYLDFNSPYRNILIYHGLGAGKTGSAINIYNVLYNASPGINVFLLLKATLKESTWMPELKKWLQKDEFEYRMANIIFISYDSPIADKAFLDAVKNADSSKRSLYIIEEAHNFIRNVYSNLSSKKGKRAQTIYDHMIQDQRDNEGTRIMLLSGSPAINSPYELALLYNLLRPGIFPKSEAQFNQEFISSSSYRSLNPSRKNLFQRRIMGLTSYYLGSTPDVFASKKVEYVDVEMSEYQEEIYTFFENVEEKMAKKSKGSSQTYSSYTRQACNFTFPLMGQGLSGEHRPRPRAFKLSEKEAQYLDKGKDVSTESNSKKYYSVQNYMEAVDDYIVTFDKYIDNINSNDETRGHSIMKDLEVWVTKYKKDYGEFVKNEKKKSGVFDELHKCSAKFLHVIFNIIRSPGPVLVYTNYVLMEGLQIFKIYLKYFGFTSMTAKSGGLDGFRYTEYHGGIDEKQRAANRDMYNEKENSHGNLCKIMMISPAGAEGISLFNVRQVHLIEPYWHEVRMMQMIGRALRMCSHKDLPLSERHVDVYRYKSVRANDGKWTADQRIEDLARGKEGLIQSFLDPIKEVAVDCVLNRNHNSIVNDHKCFQFDEHSLFDNQIGPAYKEDIFDDMKMDNGSNSTKSQTIRIKIIKISAVIQLSASDATKIIYSDPIEYWYNPDTGVVYDFELQYPIGKVGYDTDNLPKKLNKDTYIIDKLVPIPLIEGH